MPGNVRQVLVKNAFEPVEIGSGEVASLSRTGRHMRALQAASEENRLYMPGHPHGQFVMIQFDQSRANTDAGWLYATINARGEVMQFGLIASCIECHEHSPSGRVLTADVSGLYGEHWSTSPLRRHTMALGRQDRAGKPAADGAAQQDWQEHMPMDATIVPVVPPLLPGIVP
jgi:hypothetical protein